MTLAIVTILLSSAVPGRAEATTITPTVVNTHDARQVIIVTSSEWSTSYATLQTWQRGPDGRWTKPFGVMRARIGYNGFHLGSTRRQNTGTTPAGNYRIKKTFGQHGNPGTKMPYRNVDSTDYWVYDPRDPATYNVLEPSRSTHAKWRTSEAEHLGSYPTQYKYAAIVSFNLPANVKWNDATGEYRTTTPADVTKGGGIFLHVNGSGATAGCVSLYESSMLKVLQWLDPAQLPRIIMGPTQAIAGL
jgi:L,D-peptidoglycan transpeptidase YkuD (ErfK/YbiS/YcfS/YnhG family)